MPRIESIVVQVLCHATEDEEKVMKAVENVVGSDALEWMAVSSESLTGHYGDPITLIKLTLTDKKQAENVLSKILSMLQEWERDEVWGDRAVKGKHGGKLYIRLDKQAAYLGTLRISDKDSIRIQVNFRGQLQALRRRIEKRWGEDS